MSIAPLIFIIIGSIFEIFDGTLSLISETLFNEGIAPDYINTPSLIIQDELHLISGALGTIAAVYEAGVDSLITSLFKKLGTNRSVKYIASMIELLPDPFLP